MSVVPTFSKFEVAAHNVADQSSCPTRYCALLNKDSTILGMCSNHLDRTFQCSHVCCKPGARARLFGRCIDSDEDHVCLCDATIDVGSKDKIRLTSERRALVGLLCTLLSAIPQSISWNTNDVGEARLVDRQMCGVPSLDSKLVTVDDGDLDRGVLKSNDCRTWSALKCNCQTCAGRDRSTLPT